MSRVSITLILLTLGLLIPNVAAQFSNQSELSIVSTGGNTKLKVYNGKTTTKYTMGNNNFQLGGHLTKGKNGNVESADNWDLNARYGHKLSDKYSVFSAFQYENNSFSGIAYRFNKDLGAQYTITKTEKTNATIELGYRHTSQKNIVGTKPKDQHQARVYTTVSRQNTKAFFTKMWLEYLPNFTEGTNWQLNVEPSLNFAMSTNLSIKLGYLYKYDNQPVATLKKYDSQYTTTLIAKF